FCVTLPGCSLEVGWAERVVTCYRPEVRVRQVPVTTYRTVCRAVPEVKKWYTQVPVWSEETRTVYVYKEVPKVVERDGTGLRPALLRALSRRPGERCLTEAPPPPGSVQGRGPRWAPRPFSLYLLF